jgi:hypothetical protein
MLLFAQAAFATQPCVEPGMSTMSAMAAQSSEDCCATTISRVSLCVMKCADGDKLPGNAKVAVLPAPESPALMLPLTPVRDSLAVLSDGRERIYAPPKSILYCSLLI